MEGRIGECDSLMLDGGEGCEGAVVTVKTILLLECIDLVDLVDFDEPDFALFADFPDLTDLDFAIVVVLPVSVDEIVRFAGGGGGARVGIGGRVREGKGTCGCVDDISSSSEIVYSDS